MDKIFTHFLSRGPNEPQAEKRLAYAAWFVDTIPENEFEADEYLFHKYLQYSVELGVPIQFKYLQVWINSELRAIMHKDQVRVMGCETLRYEDPLSFEAAFRTTSEVLSDDYKVLETEDSDITEFKVAMSEFMQEKMKARLISTLTATMEMFTNTDNVFDAVDYNVSNSLAIQDIYDVSNLEDLRSYEEGYDSEIDNVSTVDKVSDCGLEAIDRDSRGIYRKQLFGVEAQPGTGKTRFVIGTYVYNALVKYKKNVAFYTLEQDKGEIDSMLIARHVYTMFGIFISDIMIYRNEVPAEHQSKVNAARIDLFQSGKYGKFYKKEVDFYVETFIQKISTDDKLHGPFDLVCIDYMGLIESKPVAYQRQLDDAGIIKKAYRAFKRYVRKTGKAGIAIGQFNREGIKAGEKDQAITPEMAQGGLAVYRNTDYNIAISMTETMRLQRKRRFSQPKVRSSEGFPSFICDTMLGSCLFKQVAQQAV